MTIILSYYEGIIGINVTMSPRFKNMIEYLGRVCAKANTPAQGHFNEEYHQTYIHKMSPWEKLKFHLRENINML